MAKKKRSERMTDAQIKRWLKALDSGEYRPTSRVYGLYDGEAWCYCANGVALDLFDEKPWRLGDRGGFNENSLDTGRHRLSHDAAAIGIDPDAYAEIQFANDAAKRGNEHKAAARMIRKLLKQGRLLP